MITLLQLLAWVSHDLAAHGARSAAVMSIGPHWGWVESHHWIIRICWRGSTGCGL